MKMYQVFSNKGLICTLEIKECTELSLQRVHGVEVTLISGEISVSYQSFASNCGVEDALCNIYWDLPDEPTEVTNFLYQILEDEVGVCWLETAARTGYTVRLINAGI